MLASMLVKASFFSVVLLLVGSEAFAPRAPLCARHLQRSASVSLAAKKNTAKSSGGFGKAKPVR